jgi:hypothetical protein
MGSSGHAFIAHTKALSPPAQVKDGGYGLPPHPLTARIGQRYSSRTGRSQAVFAVQRIDPDSIVAVYVTDKRRKVRLSHARLLELREDGQGRNYQFQGYSSGRYMTSAFVCSVESERAILCLPEWHPRRPVKLPARLIPDAVRVAGAWLHLRCDLSASSAARLQPADLVAAADPDPLRVHRPSLELVSR